MSTSIATLARRIGVSRLANQTGLDRLGFPVVAAIRPLSRSISVSFGKGPTLAAAQLSAIMEAAELFYSEAPPHPPLLARFKDLAKGSALDPQTLEPLDDNDVVHEMPMDWVKGFDLASGRAVLVPWQIISMDYTEEARAVARVLQFGATGLAAAFDQPRAILHGLHEVVERDCHNAWNLADDQRETTLVDHASIEHPEIKKLLATIAGAKLDVLLWDMTGQGAIPCYLAEVFDLAPHATTAYVQGSAAALAPHVAIQKALAEALQVRLTYIAGNRDDLEWSDYGERYTSVVENRRWLQTQALGQRTVPVDTLAFDDPALALAETSRRLAAAGRENITVVELSPPDAEVSVVKVIVPLLKDTPDANKFANRSMVSA